MFRNVQHRAASTTTPGVLTELFARGPGRRSSSTTSRRLLGILTKMDLVDHLTGSVEAGA